MPWRESLEDPHITRSGIPNHPLSTPATGSTPHKGLTWGPLNPASLLLEGDEGMLPHTIVQNNYSSVYTQLCPLNEPGHKSVHRCDPPGTYGELSDADFCSTGGVASPPRRTLACPGKERFITMNLPPSLPIYEEISSKGQKEIRLGGWGDGSAVRSMGCSLSLRRSEFNSQPPWQLTTVCKTQFQRIRHIHTDMHVHRHQMYI